VLDVRPENKRASKRDDAIYHVPAITTTKRVLVGERCGAQLSTAKLPSW